MMTLSVDEQLYHFADNLEESMGFDIDIGGKYDNILMCGMGGSAISSDIVASLCYSNSNIPIRVMKYPVLPKWVNEHTLVICSSYSGNTHETISIYRQAVDRKCFTVVLTAGGKLKELATADGIMCIDLPEEMHPRHSIGFMIGYTLAVVRSVGGPDLRDDIRSCIPSLKEYRDSLCKPGEGKAWEIAENFTENLPIILSDESMNAVSLRWKTQINENAKCVAFNNEMQEFNNCAIGAWKKISGINSYLMILQDGTCELDGSISKLKSQHCLFDMEYFDSTSKIENLFRALILGDYISMYVAKIRGLEAGEVPPIAYLKKLLIQRLP